MKAAILFGKCSQPLNGVFEALTKQGLGEAANYPQPNPKNAKLCEKQIVLEHFLTARFIKSHFRG